MDAPHAIKEYSESSHEMVRIRIVIPVPRSLLLLGGTFSALILGSLITAAWLLSTATP
jgi:hypothetical protein